MTARDSRGRLDDLMEKNGLSGETRLYRYTLESFLQPMDEDDAYQLSANPDPSEAVVDIYGGGHVCTAAQIGPGLAFAQSAEKWKEPGRVGVELTLSDALDQGALLYPVESIITQRAWFITLPLNHVRVRKID